MKFCIVVMLIFILGLNCTPDITNSPLKLERTKIYGAVLNPEKYKRTKYISLQNQEFKNDEVAPIQQDGSFQIELTIDHDHVFKLFPIYDVAVFASPGDSIYVTLDFDTPSQSIFSGDNAKVNNDILQANAAELHNHDYNDNQIFNTYEPIAYFDYRKSLLEKDIQNLNVYAKKNNLDTKTRDILASNKYNAYLEEVLEYGLVNCGLANHSSSIENEMDLQKQYFALLDYEITTYIEEINNHYSFNTFLDLYSNYIFSDLDNSIFFTDPNTMLLARIDRLNALAIHPLLKDKIILSTTKVYMQEGQSETAIRNQDRMYQILTYEASKVSFTNLIQSDNHQFNSPYHIDSTILPIILEDYPNKAAFIYFWSFSCRPCLMELMTWQDKLQQFPHNDVTVFSVNIDHNQKLGDKFITKHNIPGIHLKFEQEELSNLRVHFNNFDMGLPYSLLIDEDQKVHKAGFVTLDHLLIDNYREALELN